MKSQNESHVCATVFAALTIIGCSISSMLCCHKRRGYHQRVLEDAVKTWEDEGGAFVAEKDEDEDLASAAVR
jgi:hypothetical protein